MLGAWEAAAVDEVVIVVLNEAVGKGLLVALPLQLQKEGMLEVFCSDAGRIQRLKKF